MIGIWRRHFLAIEGTVFAFVAVLIAWLANRIDAPRIVFAESPSDTIAVLAAIAGTFGTLLGFVIAVIAYLFGVTGNPAFAVLRASKSYSVQWAIFKGSLYACFVATVLSITGLYAVWCSLFSRWHAVLIVMASLWALLRLARVVWVLRQMIDAEVRLGQLSRNSDIER